MVLPMVRRETDFYRIAMMYFFIGNIYIFFMALVLAILEIQIEGAHGWAMNLVLFVLWTFCIIIFTLFILRIDDWKKDI